VASANLAAASAKEDRVQARAAALPSLNAQNQFLYTQGNGTPSGIFVAANGVHEYVEQAVVHQELLSVVRRGEIRRAAAAEAIAKAKVEVAARGLNAVVIQNYYAIATAEHKLKNAQTSLSEAQQFLDITRKQEQGGEVAHADVIKAQLSVQQRQRDVEDAELAVEKAKIALAILIFPTFQQQFEIVNDLEKVMLLPALDEVTKQAGTNNPDLRVAEAGVKEAQLGVSVARYAYLPSLGVDFFYGIDANEFAAQASDVQATGRSTLPNYLVNNRQNLGYAATITLNIPVWNWGSIHSKVKQASFRARQAEIDLTLAQKQLRAELASFYREAETALKQVESLRSSADLANESLRLTLMRYQAGEATALEVVDAQSTANLARAAFSDGLLRYRVAMSNLQTLTGNF
jgi:outer membrane protein TolC